MEKITKRIVDALRPDPNGGDVFHWDCELRGFGIRMKHSGAASYLVQYRTLEGRTRRLTIGRAGTLTPEDARKRAREQLVAVCNGADPSTERRKARQATTVADLCDQYMDAARAGLVLTRFQRPKKPSTVKLDEGLVSRHIKPLLGSDPINKLRRSDIQRMVDAIAEGKTRGTFKGKSRGKAVVTGGAGIAARTVELLGGIWTWAERRELVTTSNPCRGVQKARGAPHNRILSHEELAALGKILRENEVTHRAAVTVVRLIALTGLRRGEACGLKWSEVDELGSCIRLEKTKTGRSNRPVGTAALELLRAISTKNREWVFPNGNSTGSADIRKHIADLFDAAGLADARAHDLRRTFASAAADQGFGDATIAELLGHSQRGVTARHYIRRPDSALVAAAERVSEAISAALNAPRHKADVIHLSSDRNDLHSAVKVQALS